MPEDVFQRIQKTVEADKVVLFMKGTPQMPECGFSATVIRALEQTGVTYTTYNVLTDPELRDGIKQFSNWPTVPQLYVDGEFVGGCDIVVSMYESGELEKVLASAAA